MWYRIGSTPQGPCTSRTLYALHAVQDRQYILVYYSAFWCGTGQTVQLYILVNYSAFWCGTGQAVLLYILVHYSAFWYSVTSSGHQLHNMLVQ